MVQVFISVGMSGREEIEVLKDLDRLGSRIFDMFNGNVIIRHNYDCEEPDDPDEYVGRLYYLGEAIKKLGNCDICYFAKGWQNYKGCKAEYEICKLYGIGILEET